MIIITPKEITVEWSDDPLVYDGTEQKPEAKPIGVVPGDDVSLIVTGGQTEAGNGTAVVTGLTGADASNYVLTTDTNQLSKNFNIDGKDLDSSDITATIDVSNFEFTGDPIDPRKNPNDPTQENKIVIKDGTKTLVEGTDYIVEAIPQTDVGGYEIVIKPAPGSNYKGEIHIPWTISNGKEIPGISVDPVNCEYDGQEHSPKINGVLPGDTVRYSTSPNGPWSTEPISRKNVTNETIYFEIDRPGYNTYHGHTDIIIEPKTIGIDWSNLTPVYNGQVQLPVATPTGVVPGDTVNLNVTGGGTAIGKYTATVTGIDNPNYRLPSNTSMPFEIVPSAHVHVFHYAGVLEEPTYESEGLGMWLCSECGYYYTEPIPRLKKPEPTPTPEITPEPTPIVTPTPEVPKDDPDDYGGDGSSSFKKYFKDFTTLVLQGRAVGKNAVQLDWVHHGEANFFVIKCNKCNTETETYYVKEVGRTDSEVTSFLVEGLEEGRFYKFAVSAWKFDENGQVVKLGRSLLIDVVTDGSKYTNAEAVKLTGKLAGKKKLTVTVGDRIPVEAAIVGYQDNLSDYHINMALEKLFRYEAVNKKLIKFKGNTMVAKKAGTTDVYVFAQDGAYAKIKVVIKPKDAEEPKEKKQ